VAPAAAARAVRAPVRPVRLGSCTAGGPSVGPAVAPRAGGHARAYRGYGGPYRSASRRFLYGRPPYRKSVTEGDRQRRPRRRAGRLSAAGGRACQGGRRRRAGALAGAAARRRRRGGRRRAAAVEGPGNAGVGRPGPVSGRQGGVGARGGRSGPVGLVPGEAAEAEPARVRRGEADGNRPPGADADRRGRKDRRTAGPHGGGPWRPVPGRQSPGRPGRAHAEAERRRPAGLGCNGRRASGWAKRKHVRRKAARKRGRRKGGSDKAEPRAEARAKDGGREGGTAEGQGGRRAREGEAGRKRAGQRPFGRVRFPALGADEAPPGDGAFPPCAPPCFRLTGDSTSARRAVASEVACGRVRSREAPLRVSLRRTGRRRVAGFRLWVPGFRLVGRALPACAAAPGRETAPDDRAVRAARFVGSAGVVCSGARRPPCGRASPTGCGGAHAADEAEAERQVVRVQVLVAVQASRPSACRPARRGESVGVGQQRGTDAADRAGPAANHPVDDEQLVELRRRSTGRRPPRGRAPSCRPPSRAPRPFHVWPAAIDSRTRAANRSRESPASTHWSLPIAASQAAASRRQ